MGLFMVTEVSISAPVYDPAPLPDQPVNTCRVPDANTVSGLTENEALAPASYQPTPETVP